MDLTTRAPVVSRAILAAATALTLVSCAATVTGGASGATTPDEPATVTQGQPSPPTASSADRAVTTDPCSLLTDQQIQQIGFNPPGTAHVLSGERTCGWDFADDTPGGIILSINGQSDMSRLNFKNATDITVGRHQGRKGTGQVLPGDCVYAINFGSSGSVRAAVTGPDDLNRSCQIALAAIQLIEKQQP